MVATSSCLAIYSRAKLRDAIDMAQQTETVIIAISTKAGFSRIQQKSIILFAIALVKENLN